MHGLAPEMLRFGVDGKKFLRVGRGSSSGMIAKY